MRTAAAVLILIGLVLNGHYVTAQEPTRRALAEQLLNEMNMKHTVEESFAMVKKMMPAQIEKMTQAMEKSRGEAIPAKKPDTKKRMDKMMDLIAQELSWDKVKDDYITIYAETFTEDELKGVIAFYKTPAGKSFIQKQPEVMKRSMELSQKSMMKIMPKILTTLQEAKEASKNGAENEAAPIIKEKPRQ